MKDEKMIATVKERAKAFTTDNLINPSPRDFLMIENAMLIGASITMELQTAELRTERQEHEHA